MSDENESVKPSVAKLQTRSAPKRSNGFDTKHELNLALIIVCVGALAYYIFRQ